MLRHAQHKMLSIKAQYKKLGVKSLELKDENGELHLGLVHLHLLIWIWFGKVRMKKIPERYPGIVRGK
jgi:hypothetical protein